MTDEEMAEEYANKNVPVDTFGYRSLDDVHYDVKQAYLAGLKTGRLQWHKVADGDLPKGENIHRDIYLKDRYGNLYTGNYFPKDKCHTDDCFAVEILDWGFQGSQFCKKGQILEWCEIPKYTEE